MNNFIKKNADKLIKIANNDVFFIKALGGLAVAVNKGDIFLSNNKIELKTDIEILTNTLSKTIIEDRLGANEDDIVYVFLEKIKDIYTHYSLENVGHENSPIYSLLETSTLLCKAKGNLKDQISLYKKFLRDRMDGAENYNNTIGNIARHYMNNLDDFLASKKHEDDYSIR